MSEEFYARAEQAGTPAEATVLCVVREGFVQGGFFWFRLNGDPSRVEISSVERTLKMETFQSFGGRR